MLWLTYSILAAIAYASYELLCKKNFHRIEALPLIVVSCFISTLLLLPGLLTAHDIGISTGFWWALIFATILDGAGLLLYLKALKLSDLSLVSPLVSLTPLFLILTSWIMLGEEVSTSGAVGIVIVVVGCYILNLNSSSKKLFAPIKGLFYDRGCRYMLMTAFLWAFTTNLHKMGMQASSALTWAIAQNLALSVALLPAAIITSKRSLKEEILHGLSPLMWIGIANTLATIFSLLALKIGLVPYVVSIKRTSILISVLFGALVLKEENFKQRATGAIVILIGVATIAIWPD